MPELGSITSILFWIVIIAIFLSRQKKRTGGSSNARDGARPTSAPSGSSSPAPPSPERPPVAPASSAPPSVPTPSISAQPAPESTRPAPGVPPQAPPVTVSIPRTPTSDRPRSTASEATEPSPEVVAEVTALHRKGRMIDAIEVLREATGMELYEASQFVRKLPK